MVVYREAHALLNLCHVKYVESFVADLSEELLAFNSTYFSISCHGFEGVPMLRNKQV